MKCCSLFYSATITAVAKFQQAGSCSKRHNKLNSKNQSQLKTGAKGAKEFVRPYGREGFETPVAGRSESDLAANDSAADFATDAAAAAFGADGTFRSAAVLPGDGDGDPGGGGDGDTGWGAWPASDLEEAQLEEAQLAQRMENCSMDVHLPFTNNNAIGHSKSTTPSVADSAIVMQDNDNNDDVLWCVKCGDTQPPKLTPQGEFAQWGEGRQRFACGRSPPEAPLEVKPSM